MSYFNNNNEGNGGGGEVAEDPFGEYGREVAE